MAEPIDFENQKSLDDMKSFPTRRTRTSQLREWCAYHMHYFSHAPQHVHNTGFIMHYKSFPLWAALAPHQFFTVRACQLPGFFHKVPVVLGVQQLRSVVLSYVDCRLAL